MAKRRNNGSKKHTDPARLAQRFLERDDYRQALKQARVAVRKSPGAETQRLLEQASCRRADELLRTGHVGQARDLLTPLASTIGDLNLKSQLPDLLLRAGLLDQFPEFRAAVSEKDRRDFEIELFDKAVVDLSHARTVDVREQARLVRSAMEAVEAGDDSGATEFLRGIPRRSLAADWRYFIRGLMAWYGNDADTVAANWKRLEPTRAASRIVAQLTTGDERCAPQVDAVANQDRLTADLNRFGVRAKARLPTSVIKAMPALRAMDGLQQVLLELANEDWSAVSKTFRECRSVLRQNAPELYNQIAGRIVDRMIRAQNGDSLEEFCRRVEAPPHDPNWNRARATLSEAWFEDSYDDLDTVENRWLQYLREINQIDHFSDAEKQIARALVNTRVGRLSVIEIRKLADCSCGMSHANEIAELRERAVEFLEHAIDACRACVDPWRVLVELYEAVDDSTGLMVARKRMLEEFPDDLEMLQDAAECELNSGSPQQGRDYLLQALRIKPLDDRLRAQAVMAHRDCARTFIRAAEFDAARAELAAAVDLDNGNELYHVNHLVLSAILEVSAENDFVAEGRIRDGLNVYAEPTAVNLDLTIEAARVNLPQCIVQRFEDTWRADLGKKCHTQTAGQMARLMAPGINDSLPDFAAWQAEVVQYIKRASRVRFRSIDLRSVCVFLQIAKEDALLDKYVRKGRKQFSDEPLFHLLAAEREMDKEMYDCRRRQAFNAFSRVLEICDQSADMSHQRMAERARDGLSFLNEMGLRKPRQLRYSPASTGSDALMSRRDIRALIERMAEESGLDMSKLFAELESGLNPQH